MICSVHIRNMSLLMRVERMNKGIVCVEEMGKRLGGYVLDKNSREEERRWCVACCVSEFYRLGLSFSSARFAPLLKTLCGSKRRCRVCRKVGEPLRSGSIVCFRQCLCFSCACICCSMSLIAFHSLCRLL
jgi:hypothetical protein